MLLDGILSAIGRTPLIRLRRLYPHLPFRLYGKLEALNPAGSSKDRPAHAILQAAMREGLIDAETAIIESSSGNMGVGLAQFCRYHGLRFICVVDARTASQNLSILEAYGAEIEVITEPDASGDLLLTRLAKVRSLLAEIPNSFWPDQYANRNNSASHYDSTIREILDDLDEPLDYLFCAVSTCGTIRGCAEGLRDHGQKTRVIAVDAEGSVIFGGQSKKRMVPGLGAGRVPELCAPELVADVVRVTDLDCVEGCRRLVDREAILAGGSSGGVVKAVEKYAEKIPEGANCVVILPDRGERYLDLVYSDRWVQEHFGDLETLRGRWEGKPAVPTTEAGESENRPV